MSIVDMLFGVSLQQFYVSVNSFTYARKPLTYVT